MPQDERTIFEKLFSKSAEELERIEGAPATQAKPTKPKMTPEEFKKEQRIKERIRMFNEGKDPDAKGQTGLLNEGEFDDFALEGDPMLHHLQGEIQATPAEERQLMGVVKGATDFIYGDKMHTIVRSLKAQNELYQSVSMTAFEILKREKDRIIEGGEKPEPSVFFAETGAVPVVVDALWDLSRQLQLPGSEDQDQYAGAIINVLKLTGEYIAEQGDDDAISEAEDLATTMALTREDGSMVEELGVGPKVETRQLEQRQLAAGISTALLGSTA